MARYVYLVTWENVEDGDGSPEYVAGTRRKARAFAYEMLGERVRGRQHPSVSEIEYFHPHSNDPEAPSDPYVSIVPRRVQ